MSAEVEYPTPCPEGPSELTRDPGQSGAVGAARLVAAVTFGMRAAVLAGVILVSSPGLPQAASAEAGAPVVMTVALGGPISGVSLDETTCCSAHFSDSL